jgi:hypothetical protein
LKRQERSGNRHIWSDNGILLFQQFANSLFFFFWKWFYFQVVTSATQISFEFRHRTGDEY